MVRIIETNRSSFLSNIISSSCATTIGKWDQTKYAATDFGPWRSVNVCMYRDVGVPPERAQQLLSKTIEEWKQYNIALNITRHGSGCPEYRQTEAKVCSLKEEDVYPAQPQDAYGWEKLMTERLCTYYRQDYGLETRSARFHNIFGALGTWNGGREKAAAALCRKVAFAKLTGNPVIEIWGDGEQTRSFCYIDDCLEGIHRLMRSDYPEPLNLGQDRMVTINQLADIIGDIARVRIIKKHVPGPQGVRGRNSDNTRLRQVLGWEARISLEEGLSRTYQWIERQVIAADAGGRIGLDQTPVA